ncbi:MAG TPA: DUF1178 family protein [Methylibium sp.]|uniref:DUF1178 family protein n=1 Tax=Methylibium sp. TaxID=2067992 RepID=UPI002DBA0E04|nr:DUF1178 family protein [Methylibium sp.]HEU4459669.1 DUF1178 family protein [Methylibium sp.]
MKVLNLRCTHGHGFEGWFASLDDYTGQRERGLVECPLCGDSGVERMPTAARLSLSRAAFGSREMRDVSAGAPPEANAASKPTAGHVAVTPEPRSVEALWVRAVQHVLKHTEDVGDRFATEARRIHYGEIPHRGIRGQASADETEALRDEGIEVHALPVPKALKGQIQ